MTQTVTLTEGVAHVFVAVDHRNARQRLLTVEYEGHRITYDATSALRHCGANS